MKYKNTKFLIGSFIIIILFLCMIFGLFLMPYNPNEVDIAHKMQFFSSAHILGTDSLGRDVFCRIVISLRISFIMGVAAATSACAIGTFFGSIGGYFGGITDSVVTKIIDIQMAFPGILLALMISAVFGAGFGNTLLALSIMSVPRFARIARSGFIRYRNSPLVLAEKARGASAVRIMYVHILPHISGDLVVTYALSFAFAIMNESGLSYLGLGIQPPDASFGKMLHDAQSCIFTAPWLIITPAVVLAFLSAGFMLISDGITAKKEESRV